MRYCGVACGQFRFSLRPQGVDRAFPGERPVTGRGPVTRIPSISPMCAQARRRFTQVIHMVMHSKADNTFSCRAGRQRVSVPVLARGGRPAGRRSGLGHRPRRRAPDARRIPCRQAARVPRRLPAVTLIVILPAARPRYAHAARAQPPPRWPPGLCQHDHVPEREAPVPTGDRAQQLITAPATADAGALARGGVPARDGAAPSHAGSNSGGSRTGRVPARRGPFGNLARARLDPRSSRHFCGRRGAGPARRSGRAESGTAPPCMRWRGRARPRRPGWPVAWSSPSAARRPPGPGTRARGRSPGSSRVPGVAPGWCPFPAAKALLLPPQAPRKTRQQAISCFSAIHGRLHREQAVIRIPRRLSTAFSQPIHRFPSVSRRTPQPLVPNARCYVTS